MNPLADHDGRLARGIRCGDVPSAGFGRDAEEFGAPFEIWMLSRRRAVASVFIASARRWLVLRPIAAGDEASSAARSSSAAAPRGWRHASHTARRRSSPVVSG